MALVGEQRDAKLKIHLEDHVSLVKFDGVAGSIDLFLLPGAPAELANDLREKLNAWTSRRWVVVLSKEAGNPAIGAVRRAREAAELESLKSHPAVRAVLEAFPDAKIAEVRTNSRDVRLMPTTAARARRSEDRRICHQQPRVEDEMKDIMGMMKQVGQMQARLKEVQDELGRAEIEGQSGGGLVRLTVDGKGEVKRVRIDPSLMKADEVEILEDLIVAAAADARSKSDSAMQAKMAEITGGLPLPPGLKLF